MLVDETSERVAIVAVAGQDAFAPQRPVIFPADADHLAAISVAEEVEGVIAGAPRDSRDEQRQRRVGSVVFGGAEHQRILNPFGNASPNTQSCSWASSRPPWRTSASGFSPAFC